MGRFARDDSLLTPTRQPSVRTRAKLTRGSSLTAEEEFILSEEFSSQPLPPEPPTPVSPPSPMRRIDSTGKTKLTVLLKEHSGSSELVLIRLPPQKRAASTGMDGLRGSPDRGPAARHSDSRVG